MSDLLQISNRPNVRTSHTSEFSHRTPVLDIKTEINFEISIILMILLPD